MSRLRQTVFIVDDDEPVRLSLVDLVRSIGLEVEAYESAEAFLAEYDPDRTGCLLLDVRMPRLSGLEVQERLAEMGAKIPIIFLTGHGEVSLAVRALQQGAFHFLEKPFNDQDLLDQIHLALELDANSRQERHERDSLLQRHQTLTARERQVMSLVVQGQANKVAASNLGISERTVEIHRARVMEKMQASSLADLVRMGIELQGAD